MFENLPELNFPILDPLLFVKIGILILIGLYVVFTIVVANQFKTMNRSFSQKGISAALSFIAIINIVFAVSLFLISLVIL